MINFPQPKLKKQQQKNATAYSKIKMDAKSRGSSFFLMNKSKKSKNEKVTDVWHLCHQLQVKSISIFETKKMSCARNSFKASYEMARIRLKEQSVCKFIYCSLIKSQTVQKNLMFKSGKLKLCGSETIA